MADLRKEPRRYSAAALRAYAAVRGLGRRLGARGHYARWLSRGGLRGEVVDVPVADLPGDLEGLRLVQLSDLHAGPFLDRRSLDPVLDLARAYRPDVLVLTGDFLTDTTADALELGDVFGRIPAPLGRFAVFGNHDYRGRDQGRLVAWLRHQGVRCLLNEGVLLRRGAGCVRLVGLEDIEEAREVDLEAGLAGATDADDARVLLCHHPDVGERLPPGLFDLVLSGHTHGGQVLLPVLGSLARRRLPAHLAGPRVLEGGALQYVNRGVGVLVLPFRLGAPAEVTCLALRRAP